MSQSAPLPRVSADSTEPANLVLKPRDVKFDWSALPMHWVPNEPFATHVFNVMHLLLPEGERWFVEVFKEALPLVTDDRLREDVIGFIGQEAMHADAHQGAQDYLVQAGLDVTPYVRQIEWFFQQALGSRGLTGRRRHRWLCDRLAVIAAVEHFTAFLGQWVLDSHELDRVGTDPTMLDLLRWHGAEEVEHRSVAFDLYMHVDGGYFRRLLTMVSSVPALFFLWFRGARFLVAKDPRLGAGTKIRVRDVLQAGKRGLIPSLFQIARGFFSYLPRSYHPSQHGSTKQAVAYLATSPAARAAEH